MENWKQGLASRIHFIGLAGAGMSALAQFLSWHGFEISGSDRQFDSPDSLASHPFRQLGIRCVGEDAPALQLIQPLALVLSTAIESDHPQLLWAQSQGIEILHRSEILAYLVRSFRTIAVAGTSGKSTTAAMIFHILRQIGADPSVITGAGLGDLQSRGLIGNAWAGRGEWLVIEADESDGTVERYHPEIGLLLNIDRDHKELDELQKLFIQFRTHTHKIIVGRDQERTRLLSQNQCWDFGQDPNAGYYPQKCRIEGGVQYFDVCGHPVQLPIPGAHNRSNALAALAAVHRAGFDLGAACLALSSYPGIFRRFQILHRDERFCLIDDFAHNPAKIVAALRAAQEMGSVVHAWFQPHGFAPTRFMRQELIAEVSDVLRPGDSLSFGPIYYAGGTVTRDIDSQDLVDDLLGKSCHSHLVKRTDLGRFWSGKTRPGTVLLLMGARDPSLDAFGKNLLEQILQNIEG